MKNEVKKMDTVKLIDVLSAPGFGLGSISYDRYMKESLLNQQLAKEVREIISKGVCIADCDHQDDGCIDGRCVDEIAIPEGDHFDLKRVDDNEKHERAKVAGGGLLTGLAMFKAIGEGLVSPDEDLRYLATSLAKQGIYCGAHTGAHGSIQNQKTDCGANDKFDEILKNAILNEGSVSRITKELLKPLENNMVEGVYQDALHSWNNVLTHTDNFSQSNGSTRLDSIKKGILSTQEEGRLGSKVSVLKHLKGNHNEIFVIINYAQGRTFSQTALRNIIHNHHPGLDGGQLPQVFALDMWRVNDLAKCIANIPKKDSPYRRTTEQINHRYMVSLYAGTSFQVSTYLTLTDGSLPLFIFK